jgi:HlyD family secretion protein
MSTSVSPSAAPLEAPKPAGPKALEPAPGRFSGRSGAVITAVVVAAAGLGLWFYLKPRPQQKTAATFTVHTAVVRTGTLERVLRISGNTVAGNYANVAAPMLRGPEYRNLTLVSLAKAGSIVKKGTVVAQIDPTDAKDHIDDVQAMVTQADADIRKRKAEQDINEENLRQSIRVAQSTLEKSKLDLKASEVRTPIDQELLKLTVEENEAAYKDALRDFNINLTSIKAELRILEITKIRHMRHRGRHVSDLVRFTIKTPMEGLVVMQSFWRGGDMAQIQVGDQMAPNQSFMRIVDPKSMLLEASVNQVECESIRVGQPVTVRFDAFPGIQLKGKVQSIGAIAVAGWRAGNYIRNIPVKVKLLEQHPQVIPDLTASADVVIGREENKVLVPREAVFAENGKQVVYVKQAQDFRAREVEIAGGSYTMLAVASGLRDGDVVALQHPAPPQP